MIAIVSNQEEYERICREELHTQLSKLIYSDCGYFPQREWLRQHARRKGFKTLEGYIRDLIRLEKMEQKLTLIQKRMTPLPDRGYGGSKCSTLMGSYSFVSTVTTKGIRG